MARFLVCVHCIVHNVNSLGLFVCLFVFRSMNQRLEPTEQLQHIAQVRQAVKFVADEVTGDLPGFCLPKKVCCSKSFRGILPLSLEIVFFVLSFFLSFFLSFLGDGGTTTCMARL